MAQDSRTNIDKLAINTIRTLSIDAIQKANSGHPGTAMDAAPVAIRFGSNSFATTLNLHIGSTAIASSCPPGMPRCSFTA